MTIKNWPADQRPREKLLLHGAAALSDVELLSLFVRTGTRGFSAIDVANAALKETGSLSALIGSSCQRLVKLHGFGRAHHALLQAAIELGRRHVLCGVADRDVLSSPEAVRQYLSLHLSGLEHEVFSALFLDNRHRVIEYTELFRGTIDSAAVYPREVVKHCLSRNAAAVIFAHNHPSGVAEPSDTDVRLTRKLTDALSLIDVRVLDHLIIGCGVQTSLAERGLM